MGRTERVTHTLAPPKVSQYHVISSELHWRGRVKPTDGEATFGGMRVEMVRRKTRDMAARSVNRRAGGERSVGENPGVE